jgi:hypothetical protein
MKPFMTFDFRSQMRAHAAPTQKPAHGFRALSLHASDIAEAAERFIREQLTRKRERTLRT